MKFVNPNTGEKLVKDSAGNLLSKIGDDTIVYENHDGCYDFAIHCLDSIELQKEREYFDREYAQTEFRPLLPEDVRDEWYDWMNPWRTTLLSSLGDLSKKRILLLGNGETTKEFYFAMAGADVIFTDLSLESMRRRKKQFENSGISTIECGSIEFHAVEALHLPFPDESFDIIYGSAFVHHLSKMELERFFNELRRCLKTNGICRFIDQAHSPVWRNLIKTVLWPLKQYSYWRNPRSPADIRADEEGGMRKEDLSRLMTEHGFSDMLFKREWFFLRIVTRHYGKFFNFNPVAMTLAKPLFKFLKWIDLCLVNTKFMQNNALMLIWGFTR